MTGDAGSSDWQELAGLEQGVVRLIGRIEALREENLQLTRELAEARRELEERNAQLEEVRRELSLARTERRDIAKEQLVRTKLTGLLQRLEALDEG